VEEQRYFSAHRDRSTGPVRSRAGAGGECRGGFEESVDSRRILSLPPKHENTPQHTPGALRTVPSQSEAEAAVRTLIEWAGDDPDREGLRDTPARVVRSYAELFSGYRIDPAAVLDCTFEEVGGFDELVILKDIRMVSCCEHHMLPVVGKAHVGYIPNGRVIGISKLARVVRGFSRRLQVQERLVADIASAVQHVLKPRGVGVIIEAEHSCMTLRGVNDSGVTMTSSRLLGELKTDLQARSEFLRLTGSKV
jgi:GTP cyclohydrolase I